MTVARTGRRIARRALSLLRETDAMAPVPAGTLRILATGARHPDARGGEAIIVEATTSSGLAVDLGRLEAPGIDVIRQVHVGTGSPVPVGLRLNPGAALDLALGRGGGVQFVTHPWSGEALLRTATAERRIDLHAEHTGLVRVNLAELMPLVPPPGTAPRSVDHAAAGQAQDAARRLLRQFPDADRTRSALHATLAIYTPRWRGVTAATRSLFPCSLPVPLTPDEHPDEIDAAYTDAVAQVVAQAGFATVVFSGGDPALFALAQQIKALRPSISIRLLWHGSYLQMGETHDWRLFQPWLALARAGVLARIGVVKPGMDRFLTSIGVPSCYVQNTVAFQPARARLSDAPGVVGMWLSGSSEYRKAPFSTLLALAGLPELRLRAAGLGELGFRLVEELGIRTDVRFFQPIPHAQVLAEMGKTALTLYVTVSECMPMVPFESIMSGAPCLVGPATQLFEEDPFLHARLVVQDPSDPAAIRRAILRALDERPEIFAHCVAYAAMMQTRAMETVAAFVD